MRIGDGNGQTMEKQYEFAVRYQNNPNGTNESDLKLRWFFDSICHTNREQALMMMGAAFWPNVPPMAHIVAVFTTVTKLPKRTVNA
jgi:hypothetical protein